MRSRSLASLLLVALFATSAVAQSSDRGRPIILLVHGRGLLGRDTAATRRLWLDGLRSGAATLTRGATIEDRDVRVVWYADVLGLNSNEGCDYAASDPRAARDAKIDPAIKQMASLAGGLLGLVSGLSSDTNANADLRALAGDASFLSDTRKRCASEARLVSALDRARQEGRPVILVAHSLGSVIAYDYLSTRTDTGVVQHLVTIGSMVGSPDMRRFLIGGDSTDTFGIPASVKDWVNVRNDGDPLATTLPFGRDIATTPPADEPDAHEMVGYLRGTATAREILGAWCAALSTDRPSGCKDIVSK